MMLNTILHINDWAFPNANCTPFENPCPWTSDHLYCLIVLIHHQEIYLQTFRSSTDMLKYVITHWLNNWLQMSLRWAWNWKLSTPTYVFTLMCYIFPQLESIFSFLNLLFIICHLVILKLPNRPWLLCFGWLEHCPINWKVADSIPNWGTCLGCGFSPQSGQGACERYSIDVSLPFSVSPSLPLFLKREKKKLKACPQQRIKKKKKKLPSGYENSTRKCIWNCLETIYLMQLYGTVYLL